jgi:hypothetical protein
MIKFAAKLLLIAAWAASMYWLVRHEAYPDRFAPEMAGYRTLARERAEVSDTWMKILHEGRPIGYSHGTVQLNEEAAELEQIMENRTEVRVRLLGATQRFKLSTRIMLNAAHELVSFSLSAGGAGRLISAEATRVRGQTYRLTLNLGAGLRESEIEIPADTVLFTPYLEMGLKRLRPGEEMVLNVFDPLTLGRKKIRLQGEARETLTVMGRATECLRVAVVTDEGRLLTWVDPDGRVVRQTTPFGWVLEACPGEEAIALMNDDTNAAGSLSLPTFFTPAPP